MRLALLICVLFPGSLGTNSVFVRINGTLTCSTQFEYAIELVEADTISDDLMDFTDFRTSKSSVENYEVHGWGTEDDFFNNAIEPWMRIYHSCGTKSGCVCKKWDNIYAHTEITLNINLNKNDVICDLCASPDSVEDLRGQWLLKHGQWGK